MPVTDVRDLATGLGHFHPKQMCAPRQYADEGRGEKKSRFGDAPGFSTLTQLLGSRTKGYLQLTVLCYQHCDRDTREQTVGMEHLFGFQKLGSRSNCGETGH